MRVALFCHSLLSDWNHGNAHFLRGVVTELAARGHEVRAFEPRDAWSVTNLVRDHGPGALTLATSVYPALRSVRYDLATLDLDRALEGADLVLVHEWTDPDLVRRIGLRRRRGGRFTALFHDTHHRALTDPTAQRACDLEPYDGILAFGAAVSELYARRGWGRRAFVWHEAADVRVFAPRTELEPESDVVWIGNWGDDERTHEIAELFVRPVAALGLRARAHGVRYPPEALALFARAGIAHHGWLANFHVPAVYARHRVTVHVPRRPYVEALAGVPTIRVFEALACGIPLVSGPWRDVEGLFTEGSDYLVAPSEARMRDHLRALISDPSARRALAAHGLRTIRARHTCAHRVDELFSILARIGARRAHSNADPDSPTRAGPRASGFARKAAT